jgi:probable HAF family extracellular repeat protein
MAQIGGQMNKCATLCVSVVAVWFAFTCAAGAQSFQGLGDLPGGAVDSSALGVSSNGIVVVGSSVGSDGREAVRWSAHGGTLTGLGHLPSQPVESLATAASADGGVIVGVSRMTNSSGEAFRWTLSGGMIGLGDLPGGVFSSSASGVTPDGAIVVGTSISSSSWEAYRWTQSGGMVGLGDLPGADAGGPNQSTSGANGVSADGAVIVGWSHSDWMVGEGFRWSGSFAALGPDTSDASGARRLNRRHQSSGAAEGNAEREILDGSRSRSAGEESRCTGLLGTRLHRQGCRLDG